jgi:hypothetical protein
MHPRGAEQVYSAPCGRHDQVSRKLIRLRNHGPKSPPRPSEIRRRDHRYESCNRHEQVERNGGYDRSVEPLQRGASSGIDPGLRQRSRRWRRFYGSEALSQAQLYLHACRCPSQGQPSITIIGRTQEFANLQVTKQLG